MMREKKSTVHGGPDPIDVHVGLRIRSRRMRFGLSQTALAENVGITFQQIQKYERGTNRVSASMLFRIARFLNAPISFFFEGLSDLDSRELEEIAPDARQIYTASAEGQRLIGAVLGLPERLRKKLVSLAVALERQGADQEEPDDEK